MPELNKTRRIRGSSPRGEFEQSKSVALDLIAREKTKERAKTEKLKALRIHRDGKSVPSP